ncbi:MAG: acetoin utilization protein AcuC [Verrucomicrobia bacterium]|jgi:acetoin utilization protein AcuC|nr:acetoin utilization protein AcuC [Verrucomicrobiota bacterium]
MTTAARQHALIHSPELERGGYPEACPFNTTRAGRMLETVQSMDLMSGDDREIVAPQRLTREELQRFHSPEYLDVLRQAGSGGVDPLAALKFGLGTPDCPIFKDMYDYVALAAGATVTGARLILDGTADVVFNPSGGFHHAQASSAAGFCFVNDIVLAALEFANAGKRVLFLDIDVHHCDGVQDAFYGRRDIMTVSLHESGKTLFPGTGFETEIGSGLGEGYTVNVPLPVGTYDAAYEGAFKEAVLPLIRKFGADVIILELGMDALAGDPLAHLHLTNNTHAGIVEALVEMSIPILATGGGGYHVENTVRGWVLCWSVLCGEHQDAYDFMLGMGGVMMENTDWVGGLRDRSLLADGGIRENIDAEIDRVSKAIQTTLFPLHGL